MEDVSGLLDLVKLSPIAFLQLLLLGLGFVVWKFLNKFFDHNKQQSLLLNQMMIEIKSEFSTHRDFVKVLKSDLQDDISKLGQNLDLLEQRVDSLSTSVTKLEFIADLLRKG